MRIEITGRFDGYPDGKARRAFSPGERPADLPPGYAEMLVAKGLAKPIEDDAAPKRRRKGTRPT